MIVCKFGGSSVASKDAAIKIKEIFNENDNRKIIVVSALGKCKRYNYKITDKLFELYNALDLNAEHMQIIEEIFLRYEELSKELNVLINWNKYKKILTRDIENSNYTKEYIVSRGEYYSALLYSKYLNANFLDAKNYIIFNKNGKIDEKLTKKLLNTLNFNKKYVIGGFYGAYKNKDICVFDRGGSDITGAVISKLLNAEIYENFTDVEGVFNRNPNVFEGAKNLPLLSYKTAIQMADGGNEVVHRQALLEMKDCSTLLLVKSTYNYKRLGTIVVEKAPIIYNDMLICKTTNYIATFTNLNTETILKINKFAELSKIIYLNKLYYVFIKNIYVSHD